MKSFVSALILFAVISAVTFTTAFMDTRDVKALKEESERLVSLVANGDDSECQECLTSFRTLWEKSGARLSYTVSDSHLSPVESALAAAEGAFLSGDRDLFTMTAHTLRDAASQLYIRVRPSLDGII